MTSGSVSDPPKLRAYSLRLEGQRRHLQFAALLAIAASEGAMAIRPDVA